MSGIKIVTDSTADLPKRLVAEYGITVVPLKVIFEGDEPLRDGVDIETEQFYHRQIQKKEMSRTSQPTPAEFALAYSELAAGGNSIISIHISAGMSGTYQSAVMAKELLPGADIEVIDSRVVSLALGLLVLEAARAAKEGKSKEEILKDIDRMISEMQVYFVVDTLEYLARGGRIGKAQAFLGTILNVKPILYLKDGLIHPYEKVRGKARAIERLAQIAGEKAGRQKVKCALVHGMDPDGMEQLRLKIANKLNYDSLVTSTLGAVVGTHVGPGVVGFIFIPE
ncbi:MAG: DegV family protein [Peptococcaceae bacterium]|nr:DegV family protein [Peptococcaceae bacterium]